MILVASGEEGNLFNSHEELSPDSILCSPLWALEDTRRNVLVSGHCGEMWPRSESLEWVLDAEGQ